MNKPWHIGVAFIVCLAAVLGAMGWVSVAVLRLERTEEQSQRNSERDENARLALWRMDSALSPIIAAENARPYFVYRSFYPLERAFGNMLANFNGSEILMPSPLLAPENPYIQLHFQIDPDGSVNSPQVPDGKAMALINKTQLDMDNLADSQEKLLALKKFVRSDKLLSVLPREELSQAMPVKLAPNLPADIQIIATQQAAEFQQAGQAIQSEAFQTTLQQAGNDLKQSEQVEQPQAQTVAPNPPNIPEQKQQEELEQKFQKQNKLQQNDQSLNKKGFYEWSPDEKNTIDNAGNTKDNNAGNRQALRNDVEWSFRSNAYRQMQTKEKEIAKSQSAYLNRNGKPPQQVESSIASPQMKQPEQGVAKDPGPVAQTSKLPEEKPQQQIASKEPQPREQSNIALVQKPAPTQAACKIPEPSKPGPTPQPVQRRASKAGDDHETQNIINQPMPRPQLVEPSEVAEGMMLPLWLGDQLVLARRCAVNDKVYIQGCWLNWNEIKQSLLEDIRDLLPNASLIADTSAPTSRVAERAEPGERTSYMLASLPVRLVPGAIEFTPMQFWSPLRLSLLIAWACVLVAAAAVGALLLGVITLSERRGAFVSAVTHELRTPLTTFRMYTEMLTAGMVSDEAKKTTYLNTLRVEAERLSHLVENVLAYARLERGPGKNRLQTVTLEQLLEKTFTRLSERAQQAGMNVSTDISVGLLASAVKTDPSIIEQILFNLVDNACKYASSGSDKRIEISAFSEEKSLTLRVRDYGPGFAQKELKNLFKPFSKSARDAAHSAPGVGLGLALSRRLARDMGGDLKLAQEAGSGATFLLTIPLA